MPELLSLQSLLSDPAAHDELLFIVVHQTYELWFKQVLFELDATRDALFAGETRLARRRLERVHVIERVLVSQVDVIETMSPQEFLEFRSNLAPASGFQSVQFREVEIVSGLREPGLVARVGDASERVRLERRLREPTLWDGFRALLEANGLPMPADDPDARRDSLVRMMRDPERFADVVAVAEALLTHDELVAMWRLRHVLMVERQIGSKTGTGGSAGAGYLKTTLEKRFFPELWEVRSSL